MAKKKKVVKEFKRKPSILKRKEERKLKRLSKKENKKKHFEYLKLNKLSEEDKMKQADDLRAAEEEKKKKAEKKKKQKIKKLEKFQEKQRKIRLMEDNEAEEQNIKKLEKLLHLKKRKSKRLPQSFINEGWDYLLGTEGNMDFGDEDDVALSEESEVEESDADSDDELEGDQVGIENDEDISMEDGDEIDGENEEDESNVDENEGDGSDIDEKEGDESDGDENEGDGSDCDENVGDVNDGDEIEGDANEEENEGNESDENAGDLGIDLDDDDSKVADETETWEDIYGRTRKKDGSIVDSKSKYIPPALRKAADSDQKKNLERLKKKLKGNLNRLAESNMHSIALQIEDMYRKNSRRDMNEALFSLITEAIVAPVLTPERLVMEYAMLITILHANIGAEVGAHFIEEFNNLFLERYRQTDLKEEPGKELDNIVMILSYFLNFKIIDSKYIFELLAVFTKSFQQKDIELILICLRTAGFLIRKADPVSMKNLIIAVQNKASACDTSDARVKFMLDVLMAVKNNNVNKIPNYDPEHIMHLLKILKTFIREGNYVVEMKIGMKDLEDADTLGRWWVVGSFYAGNLARGDEPGDKVSAASKEQNAQDDKNAELLELARKMRMNTDQRKKIFCTVMSADDYLDAYEKILKLGTKNQMERDVMFVLLDCSLQEKTFNPYYAHLGIKLSEVERKYRLANQFCIWDKLKLTAEMKDFQLMNLGKYISLIIRYKSQSIGVLRTIQFAEMNKTNVKLLRLILCDVLMQEKEDELKLICQVVEKNQNWKMFSDGLKLFMQHFIIKKRKHLDPDIDFTKLQKRVALAETYLGGSKLKL